MEGIKEAIAYIAGLAVKAEKPETIEINGRPYCTKDVRRHDAADKAEPILPENRRPRSRHHYGEQYREHTAGNLLRRRRKSTGNHQNRSNHEGRRLRS